MTVTTTTHLNFRGQAREALELYASIFGGQVVAVTYGDAHVETVGAVPDQLMWGGFEAPNGLRLMAFDVPPGRPFSRGEDSVFVAVRGDDPDEIARCFDVLAEGVGTA
jgi:PhnB protein